MKVDSLGLWFTAGMFFLILYTLPGNRPFWRADGSGKEERPEKESFGVIMAKKYSSQKNQHGTALILPSFSVWNGHSHCQGENASFCDKFF